ncbi:MAG: hypothetical protein K2Z81_00500, partial [Cyanobacteria bacterium]|nr:hypothetical protein [Cyanobacteriota bacterium]
EGWWFEANLADEPSPFKFSARSRTNRTKRVKLLLDDERVRRDDEIDQSKTENEVSLVSRLLNNKLAVVLVLVFCLCFVAAIAAFAYWQTSH